MHHLVRQGLERGAPAVAAEMPESDRDLRGAARRPRRVVPEPGAHAAREADATGRQVPSKWAALSRRCSSASRVIRGASSGRTARAVGRAAPARGGGSAGGTHQRLGEPAGGPPACRSRTRRPPAARPGVHRRMPAAPGGAPPETTPSSTDCGQRTVPDTPEPERTEPGQEPARASTDAVFCRCARPGGRREPTRSSSSRGSPRRRQGRSSADSGWADTGSPRGRSARKAPTPCRPRAPAASSCL